MLIGFLDINLLNICVVNIVVCGLLFLFYFIFMYVWGTYTMVCVRWSFETSCCRRQRVEWGTRSTDPWALETAAAPFYCAGVAETPTWQRLM